MAEIHTISVTIEIDTDKALRSIQLELQPNERIDDFAKRVASEIENAAIDQFSLAPSAPASPAGEKSCPTLNGTGDCVGCLWCQ